MTEHKGNVLKAVGRPAGILLALHFTATEKKKKPSQYECLMDAMLSGEASSTAEEERAQGA